MKRKLIGHAKQLRERIQLRILRKSGLFDAELYLRTYPDIGRSGISPARHYLLYGGGEHRMVSEKFDILAYINAHPLVRNWKMNPVIYHQLCDPDSRPADPLTRLMRVAFRCRILLGRLGIMHPYRLKRYMDPACEKEIRTIRQSPHFDADFYLDRYPALRDAGIDPALHYHTLGWKMGLDPSAGFHTDFYLSEYPDARATGIDPLLHYIRSGSPEELAVTYDTLLQEAESPRFEAADDQPVDASSLPVKLVAFYLPQFHTIPENDEWWGEGFTEWTHVRRSIPRFTSHKQPRLPLGGDFYDLREPAAMERQVRMAKDAGLRGFCFYYYWFNGKRLLEKPLDMFLGHPEWNFDFSICWANENWTRRWDGNEQDVLMGQQHSADDDIAFLDDASRYLIDERYIRVDGRPLLIIYRPSLFPDIRSTVRRWRTHFRNRYGQDLYIAMTQTFGHSDPRLFDMDAAIEFPPHNLAVKDIGQYLDVAGFNGRIFETLSLINRKPAQPPYTLYRGLMLNWDNTPRKGKNGIVYLGNTPGRFATWLDRSISATLAAGHPEGLVFINAWNEWGEGTCLEPDNNNGYAYLNTVRRLLRSHMDGDGPQERTSQTG